MSEHLEQVKLVAWFRKTYKEDEHIVFAIPNSGQRSLSYAAKLKAEGMLPGVPDLFIPTLNLWIEMKDKGGKLNKAQEKVIQFLDKKAHHCVNVCYSFEEAKEIIETRMDTRYGLQ